jgi:hypothetical protein
MGTAGAEETNRGAEELSWVDGIGAVELEECSGLNFFLRKLSLDSHFGFHLEWLLFSSIIVLCEVGEAEGPI